MLRSTLSSRQKSRLALLFPKIRQKSEMAYSSFTSIDWSRTKAYCSEVLASPPSIWINLKGIKPQGIVDPAEYNGLVEFIIEKLAELKDPRTGKPVINRVYRRNEIFQGPFSREGADLILDWWSEDSLFSTQPSFPEDTGKPALIIREHRPSVTSEWGGTHRLNGILIARGSDFKSGAEIANARLIDIAPTLLHLLGVPVPEDMDGKVLTSAFQPEFLSRARGPIWRCLRHVRGRSPEWLHRRRVCQSRGTSSGSRLSRIALRDCSPCLKTFVPI